MKKKELFRRLSAVSMAAMMTVTMIPSTTYAADELFSDVEVETSESEDTADVAVSDADDISDADIGVEEADEAADVNVEEDEEDNSESGDAFSDGAGVDETDAFDAGTDTPAENAVIHMTVSVAGEFAKDKNGGSMVDRDVTVKDLDQNGILTCDEALIAAHDEYYKDGAAAGYATADGTYGKYISKFWGDTSGAFGYWLNDNSCMGLSDEVKADDYFSAFVYKTTDYSDVYTKFTQKSYTTEANSPITVELQKAVWDNDTYKYVYSELDGAKLTAYDTSFNALAEDAYSVDGDSVTFTKGGSYYLAASGTESVIIVPTVAKVTVADEKIIPVTGLKLSKTELNMQKGAASTLTATVEPTDATFKDVTWISSDPTVASVEEGRVTGLTVGKATITATAGEVSVSCEVTVTAPPKLGSVKIYKSQQDYKDGKEPLEITPAFSSNQHVYDVKEEIADYNALYAEATLADEFKNFSGSIMFSQAYSENSYSGTRPNKDGVVTRNIYYPAGYAGVYAGTRTDDTLYKFNIKAYATLLSLNVDAQMDRKFDQDVTSYHAYVDKNAEGVTLTASGRNTKYTITVNGTVVPRDTAYTVPYNWDKNGKMKIEVVVGGNGKADHTYTIEAEPYPEEDTPKFVTQPKSGDYIVGDTTDKLSFIATCKGKLTYQWYSNTEDSNKTGTAIEGATEATYQPSAEKEGTTYYYCVATNTEQTENNTATSDAACITIDKDPTPEAVVINPGTELDKEYPWNFGYVYNVADTATELSVKGTSPVEGGTMSYQWVRNSDMNSSTGVVISSEATCTPQTTTPNDTGYYYHCWVTYTYKGKKYSTEAKTGKKYIDENGEEQDVTAVFVYVKAASVGTPTISKQPQSATYMQGDTADSLNVSAKISGGGTRTYQWYMNDTESTENATAIEEATSSSYTPDTADAGTKYYYCVVTNTLQGKTAAATSEIAKIVVNSLDDIIGDSLKGKGTQEDPYLIATAEDYQTVASLVARGVSFKNRYLKQTSNITLPKNWKPIGVTKDGSNNIKNGANLSAFSGYLDGNSKTVSIPSGGLPLLGYVKEAEVHNLKIYGKKIAGYGLVNNFEGVGLSGSAIIIDNVTLKSGSGTLKSGLIGANITTNGFAGCSAGFVATIRNCTIESGVVVGYNKDQSIIGGIAGRLQGTIENCVSHATVYGKSYVGGIVGSRDNAMGTSKVYGCTFDGTVVASSDHAGGIVGGGYFNSTAPNGAKLSINNCKSSGTITGTDKVGGIIGGDSYVTQTWENVKNTVKGNSFTGKVSATDGTYVGGIIGYYASLDKWDGIVNNYYAKDCGAEKGIGFVVSVDTTCKTHETESGAVYYMTGEYSRTDDPLGADADQLTNTEGVKIYVEELQVSGECKDTFYLGEELDLDGLSIKALYSDGTSKEVDWKELEIEGFDNTVKGEQTLNLKYDGATASKTIKVLAAPDSDPIHVSFTLLGDEKHGANTKEIHTLDGENLTTWVETGMIEVDANATVYEVIKSLEEKYEFKVYDRETQYGTYIYAIEYKGVTLSEFDNGTNSGWMDTVNDVHPGVGVAKQYLNDGDVIILHYTDDYNQEDKVPVAVKTTKRALTNLPEAADLALDNKAAVETARKAYDALTDEQKAMIPDELVKKLEAAEARMKELHVHTWDEGKVTKEATCKEEGMKLYTCTECGETKTEVLPKTNDHKYTWKVVSKATVFAPEKRQGTCSVCGKVVTKDNGSKLKATIKLNATSIKLQKKQTTKKIKVTMANGDSVKSWTSSNKKIVTVNKNGVIKAGKKSGTAKITVTLKSGKKATLKVKVQSSKVKTTKISGLKKNVTLKKGKKLTLKPVISPLTSQEKVTYSSSNKKVATVSKNGVITAKKKGTVKITVKSGKKSYVIKVKVK